MWGALSRFGRQCAQRSRKRDSCAAGVTTSRSKAGDADLSGVERVDGGGYGEPNRDGADGPGSTEMCRCGKVALLPAIPHVIDWDIAPLRDAPL